MNKKQKGNCAEFFARMMLRTKFYRIIETNYVTGRGVGCGEIDIVALFKKTLVFVEVKERKNLTDALYAISDSQRKRIIRAAEVYLARHPAFHGYDVRFDAVLVSGFRIKHIKNAYM